MFFRSKADESEVIAYIEENRERFYRIAYSYTRNKEDALDVLQDSIYKALINIDSLKKIEHVRTWFYRILIHTAIDFLRKRKRIVVVDESYFEQFEAKDAAYTRIEWREALDQLDDEQKTIVMLRFFEDMKIDDIAKVLSCNVNTVKTRLYSALRKMKIEMEGDWSE
ncbi:MAG: sigma-70 family RNA polymerase sigma factor [Bacilli bacterium]